MRLVNYLHQGQPRIGLLIADQVYDLLLAHNVWQRHKGSDQPLTSPDGRAPTHIIDLLSSNKTNWRQAREVNSFLSEGQTKKILGPGIIHPADALVFLPPVQRPGKIICVGLNYPPPDEGFGRSKPGYPTLFHKAVTSLTGHKSPILIPRISRRVEYEGELTLVIGKYGKYIEPKEASSLIAGYTIANDVGAKDIEARSSQWTSGKMLDTFCPLGPALVSSDEVSDPNSLRIQTTLNEEPVQDGDTAQMYFNIPYLISYISSLATLEPGDLILTGSPKRLGEKPDPRLPLNPGDTVSVQIEQLGTLINPVHAEEANNE